MINIAIIGVGNCANALYQGLHYYNNNNSNTGLTREKIGGYGISDINVVAAFDIDVRKIGKNMKEAILQKPNCTPLYVSKEDMKDGPIVHKSPVLDGVSPHMLLHPNEDETFKVSDKDNDDVCQILKDTKTDILINYLPVGSQKATEYFAECCLNTNVSFLNCIPVFIASDPVWEQKFVDKGIPLIGDDMKSQFGASILSQMFQELAFQRGIKVKCHIQRNIGGNTDFLNMIERDRLKYKKISKENVIRAQNRINEDDTSFCHAGPSEYISYHKDNKIANFHIEMEGFMSSPMVLDAQLSVIDSPNSAGIVIDAIRYLKIARELGLRGSIRGPSAFTQKTSPVQMNFSDTKSECDSLANRELTKMTKEQVGHYNVNSLYKKYKSYNSLQ